MIRITWYGHACFRLEAAGSSIVTDPFTPESAGLEPVQDPADAVVISSALDDAHSNAAMIPGAPAVYNAVELVGRRTEILDGIVVEAFATMEGSDRPDDPKANAMYRLELDGLAVCHMGDVGNPLREEQLGPLRDRVDVLLALAGGGLTIALPDLKAAVAEIRPRVVIPMHYETPSLRYDVGPLEDFLADYPAGSIVRSSSSTLELDEVDATDGPTIHVLTPQLDPKAREAVAD